MWWDLPVYAILSGSVDMLTASQRSVHWRPPNPALNGVLPKPSGRTGAYDGYFTAAPPIEIRARPDRKVP